MSQRIFLTGLLVLGAASALAAELQQTQRQVRQREQIYGQLMTPRGRVEYRNRMRAAKTREGRERIRAEHRRQMQERARQRDGSWRSDRLRRY